MYVFLSSTPFSRLSVMIYDDQNKIVDGSLLHLEYICVLCTGLTTVRRTGVRAQKYSQ